MLAADSLWDLSVTKEIKGSFPRHVLGCHFSKALSYANSTDINVNSYQWEQS